MNRKCPVCKAMMEGKIENYHYTECGLSSVSLRNILVFHCECGAIVPVIPQPANLHRRIVMDILKKSTLLSGEEIRFLRKMAGFTSVELAGFVGVHAVSVTRWEKGTSTIGKANDRVLRLICFVGMLQEAIQSQEKDKEAINGVAAWARGVADLNVKLLLENLESRSDGSTHITIDPATLSEHATEAKNMLGLGRIHRIQ